MTYPSKADFAVCFVSIWPIMLTPLLLFAFFAEQIGERFLFLLSDVIMYVEMMIAVDNFQNWRLLTLKSKKDKYSQFERRSLHLLISTVTSPRHVAGEMARMARRTRLISLPARISRWTSSTRSPRYGTIRVTLLTTIYSNQRPCR